MHATENQTLPTVIAQINHGTGERFKARLFGAIAHGAKGLGVWRDNYLGNSSQSGNIELTPWWPNLPDIRREIDKMMPLIQQPHWDRMVD